MPVPMDHLPVTTEELAAVVDVVVKNGTTFAKAATLLFEFMTEDEGRAYLAGYAKVKFAWMKALREAGFDNDQAAYQASIDYPDPMLLVVKSIEKATQR